MLTVIGLSTLSAIAHAKRNPVPKNVELTECGPRSFSLVDTSTLSEAGQQEWANQVGIGLLARGFSVCRPDPLHPSENVITLDSSAVTVQYGEIVVQRPYNELGATDDESTGLTIAVITEEVVLIATDPNIPKPPPPPKPAPPRVRFRLGVDATALAYKDTHLGWGAGARYDLMLGERWRLGVTAGYDRFVSNTAAAGYVRYNVIETQVAAHYALVDTNAFTLAAGLGAAPGMAFARGFARDGFSGRSQSHLVLIARALVDAELHVSNRQTIVLRAALGRPLASFDARGDTGAEYGGVATWEARCGLGWLWSFY